MSDYNFITPESHVLRQILEEERRHTIQFSGITARLDQVLYALRHPVTGFVLYQLNEQGDFMPITGIAPGGTGQFAAQPVDKNGNNDSLPAGVVPNWTSSDTTNAPVTFQSPDGLSCTVTVASNAPGGTQFTLTCSATLPDNTKPTGSAAVPIFALEVAAFVINQTA
jgi:hypothetical protein